MHPKAPPPPASELMALCNATVGRVLQAMAAIHGPYVGWPQSSPRAAYSAILPLPCMSLIKFYFA
jgi:hypothetical protein